MTAAGDLQDAATCLQQTFQVGWRLWMKMQRASGVGWGLWVDPQEGAGLEGASATHCQQDSATHALLQALRMGDGCPLQGRCCQQAERGSGRGHLRQSGLESGG